MSLGKAQIDRDGCNGGTVVAEEGLRPTIKPTMEAHIWSKSGLGGETKVAKYHSREANACFATCTLPRKDNFRADQWLTARERLIWMREYMVAAQS